MADYKTLFKPIKVGGTTIKNRLVMSPMVTNFAELDGGLSRKHFAYIRERARGGVGLIITEATSVSWPEGKIAERQISMKTDDVTTDLRELADSVHAFGAKLLPQIHHGGFMAVPGFCGGVQSMAPSAVNGAREMTLDDIARVKQDFIDAAVRAQKAGFDGVEVHAAHMYLLSQFLSPAFNHREDAYGGSIENRGRLLKEIITGIREACPSPFILDVRLGVCDANIPGGLELEDGVKFAKMCEDAGADMLNVSVGCYSLLETETTQWDPEGVFLHMSEAVKGVVSIPISVVGKMRTPDFCAEAIESGKTDMVTIGRQFICDPHWANKVRQGKFDQIRTCLNCLDGCVGQFYFNHNTVRCSINPYVGYEDLYNEHNINKKGVSEKIVVVGGGISGMQFSIISKQRGNEVILLEKGDHLGGNMYLAGKTPFKTDVQKALAWFEQETKRVGVDIRMNTPATVESIVALKPDKVVLSMGTVSAQPPIPGLDKAVSAEDYLLQDTPEKAGSKVVVVGGGTVGCEVAHKLAEEGCKVTVIEMLPELCNGHEFAHKMLLTNYLNEKAEVYTSATVTEIAEGKVCFKDAEGAEKAVDADKVIYATGMKAVSGELYDALSDLGCEVYRIGDWKVQTNFLNSTRSAFELAYSI